MSEEHTYVERRVPEHLADYLHEAITLILKSHGYDDEGDEIKNYTPEERRAVMQEILPHVTNMFKEEYDAYLKRNEVAKENN
jgi:hypothetical protein